MRPTFIIATLALALSASPALADGFSLKGPPKMAFIYYADKGDGGWQQAFEEARVKIDAAFGQKVPYIENVPDSEAQIRAAAELYVQRGFNVILGTSYGYSDTFKLLAQKFPEVAFLNASGTTNGPNLQSYYGRSYESHYLCGMVAGAMTKTGKIGFVAAHPLGIVNWVVNGYALGVRKTNPSATVTAVFTGSWADPLKERVAAEALVGRGVDVIGEHVNGPTPELVAQEHGLYSTAHHRDKTEYAPKANICSAIWTWDRFLVPEIKKVAAGGWKPNPYGAFLGIKDGGTDVVCCSAAVPKAVVDQVNAERAAIVEGKHVFAGPLSDLAGKERVAAGQVLSDADLWKMDWYVPGVITVQR
jgi:basic membrane lipoprotein Med (substrate-binding protein (PBP1-ABC) superfamily)